MVYDHDIWSVVVQSFSSPARLLRIVPLKTLRNFRVLHALRSVLNTNLFHVCKVDNKWGPGSVGNKGTSETGEDRTKPNYVTGYADGYPVGRA